ncbi:MAG: hypothetical protein KGJ45_12115, partial [Elusimicrobia bacterium]|nr:hypothetical protein [Elusimicrobiota bacterium]
MPNAFADLPPVPTAKGNAFADLPPVSTAKGNAFADLPPATPVAAAKSTTPQQPMGWGETVKQAVRNIPSSAMAQVEGLVDMARHPIRTADSAAGTIAGAAYAAGLPKPGGAYRAEAEADERKARQFAQFYKDRYGSVEGFKRSLAKDPVGVGLDAATLASAGAGAARLVRGGAKAATLGEVASDAATAGAERKPGLVRQAYQKTRAAFDPSRASEQARASALFIRKAKGLQGAQADRIGYQLGKLSGRMERSTPEQINGFYKFVENRSKAPETGKPGVVLGADKLGPRGTVTGNEYEF